MSENTFTRQDKIYIAVFALQLTDEYINQPKFENKKLLTINLPSGATLNLVGNVQHGLRELRQYYKGIYEQNKTLIHVSMRPDSRRHALHDPAGWWNC